jgi:hypothetical protein
VYNVSLDLHSICTSVSLFLLLAQLRFLCSTAGEIGLMLATLSVSEVGSIVLVYRQAKTTFEAADVILEEIWIFVEIDGLQSKSTETFASVSVRSLG